MSHIEGLDELLDEIDDLTEGLLNAAREGLEKGLKRTVAAAKLLVNDDAEIRNSITSLVERGQGRLDGTVLSTQKRSVYREMGTGPVGQASDNGKAPIPVTYTTGKLVKFRTKSGEIREKWLHGWYYFDRNQGGVRFTRGQPARPFLHPAYQQTKEAVKADIADAIKRKREGNTWR